MIRIAIAFLILGPLLAGCTGQNPDRQNAFEAAARWQDLRLAPHDSVTAFLTDGDAHVRLAAVKAAGLIGRNDVLTPLLDILEADPSVTVRAEAAWNLGLIGDSRALEAVEDAVRDRHAAVREAALAALAHLPNEGTVLMQVAVEGTAKESALAWNALRNQAADLDADRLRDTIRAGLGRPEADVQWRVLRCIEAAADTALVSQIAPFARSPFAQVRVHAYRALGRMSGSAALEVVVDGFESHGKFRGREHARVTIAGCRALGSLGPASVFDPRSEMLSDQIASLLITAAGDPEPHVGQTALAAMAGLVEDLPAPPEAAEQESLLPVWRIRLARSADAALQAGHVGVRREAITAVGALRGAGSAQDLALALNRETAPQALAACLTAFSRHHPDPVLIVARYARADFSGRPGQPERPAVRNGMVRAAACEGLASIALERPDALPPGLPESFIADVLTGLLRDPDFVVATTCAGLIGDFGSDGALEGLLDLWDRAQGAARSDLRRGVLSGLMTMFDLTPVPRGSVMTTAWTPSDSLQLRTVQLLRQSFDSPDIRIRREGREAAIDTGLLPDRLIPTEGSLLATLPAVVRSPRQPAIRTGFDAPELRCRTPHGEFIIQLNGHLAPNTCALFLDLVDQGYFDNLTFHRVVPDFVVQGGDPLGNGWGGPGFSIRSEWSRTPYTRGKVGIAHDGKDTGGSQFFVTLSEQPHLNGRYTIFGEVTKGMEIVDLIEVHDRMSLSREP